MKSVFGEVDGDIDAEVVKFIDSMLGEHGDPKQIAQALVHHATRLALCSTDCGHQISAVLMGEFVNVVTEHIVDDISAKFSEASGEEAEKEKNNREQLSLTHEPDGSETIH